AVGICEAIDPAIKDKVAELIGMSVRRVSDVKRYLEHYVKNNLFKGTAIPPKTRRRYFPRRKDIANEIAKIKREKLS
ncbi:calcium-responsive transcription factor isoform X2, partial [Paramuricea clavata]